MIANLLVDAGIFIAFLVASNPSLTGISLHEWLSVAFAGTILLHILMHWKWVVTLTRQFFYKLFHVSRLQYVIDALLLIAFTGIMLSGLMISKSVLPTLGLQASSNQAWRVVHATSASASLFLVGLHFALHWNWLTCAVKCHILSPLAKLFKSTPRIVPVPAEVKHNSRQL